MAESTRSTAQKKRAEGREQRRSLASEPFEKLDEAARGQAESAGSPELRETLKRAAVTAVAAAGVGALAGVAKTLLDRRGTDDDEGEQPEAQAEPEPVEADDADDGEAEGDEPEASTEPAEPEESNEDEEPDDEPQAHAEPAGSDDDEDDDKGEEGEEGEQPEGNAEPVDDEQQEAEQQDEDDGDEQVARDDSRPDDSKSNGSSNGDPGKIIPRAREEIERLLGREAESVSGFEHDDDGHWHVMLEVLEVRRVPDSTDVLATYELVLDDDGHVASMSRRRRYKRSQLEDDT